MPAFYPLYLVSHLMLYALCVSNECLMNEMKLLLGVLH